MIFELLITLANASESMYCSDIQSVAKEAVEYYMTGAPSTDLPLDCATKRKWKYFNPKNEERSPEPGPVPKYVWFDAKRDKYEITDIKKDEDKYKIHVTYTINGVKSKTIYTYLPWDFLQKNHGVCGIVINDEFNKEPDKVIIRSECAKK